MVAPQDAKLSTSKMAKLFTSSKMAFTTFVVAMTISPSEGFRSAGNAPFAAPFGPEEPGPRTRQSEDWAAIFKARNRLKTPKYDLGIGKNPPVNFHAAPPSQQQHERERNYGIAGEFIVDHVGIQKFPSPQLRDNHTELPQSIPQKKKVLPRVQPIRKVTEFLDIQQWSDSGTQTLPVMMPIHDSSAITFNDRAEPLKLDPNTIWVEMMLHDEMTKLVTATHN
jgi:hypothetical protein